MVSSFNCLSQCGDCFESVQLITNGNFSQGNNSFSTDLSLGSGFLCPLCPEGTYAVGPFAWLYHGDFVGQDHTNPPNGQFMIINGTAQEGINVWCQTVNVLPNTDYTFSYWVRDVSSNSNPHPMGVLHASFNGILEGDSIVAEGGWNVNTILWNSGDQTSLEICIVNYQSNPGGNDFGLDDISLTACHPISLTAEANAGSDKTICSGESISLGSHSLNGYNYDWSTNSNISVSDIGQPTLTLENPGLVETNVTFYLNVDSSFVGCTTQDSVLVTVLPLPTINISGDNIICSEETTSLTALGFFNSVLWSTNETENSIVVSEAGTYTATAELNTCTQTASFLVEQIELPEINLGDDLSICETSLPIAISSDVISLWSTGAISNQIIVENGGNYFQSIEQAGCIESDTVQVIVYDQIIADIPEEYFLCENSTVTLQSTHLGQWSTGISGYSSVVNEPGVYSIQVSNGPCSTIDGTTVSLVELPSIDLGPDQNLCEGESLRLDVFDSNASFYLWSDGDTTSSKGINKPGAYSVELGNQCGTVFDEIEIFNELCDWNLYAPSSFTPNGDDLNDEWRVYGFNVSNVKIFIYNRLGDIVWQTSDINLGWNPDEYLVAQDIYNFRVEGIDYLGNEFVKLGMIQLLR